MTVVVSIDEACAVAEALLHQGRFAEAEDVCRRVIAAVPDHAPGHHTLGIALERQDRLEEAESTLRRAAALQPDHARTFDRLGFVQMRLGRRDEAVASFGRAVAIDPDFAVAFYHLGVAWMHGDRLDEAMACFERALALAPALAEAHNNLGSILRTLGRYDEAVAAYARAVEVRPDYVDAHSNLIFALDFMPGVTPARQQQERRRWYDRHGRRFTATIAPHANPPDPERPLKVGYVSGDFRRHSAAYLFGPVVRNHDPEAFPVFCYAGGTEEDDLTATFRARARGWRWTEGLSDDALAETIRADGIDILVDLSAHTAGNRLLVFARKPAPVQVTGWGHAEGTGLPTIDAFLADPVLVEAADRPLFAEEVVDLPCFLCYEPPPDAPPVAPLPALTTGHVTYGCFNRFDKMSAAALAAWARIVRRVPGARLVLKNNQFDDPERRHAVTAALAGQGVAPERVSLLGETPHAQHLAAFGRIDIGLDPFPMNGGTSTLEAAWLGVPTVALAGTTTASRVGAALDGGLGLPHLVAADVDAYIDIAVGLASDLPALSVLRATLRPRMAARPIGNPGLYTAAVETVYRDLWRRWCARNGG
ncbi:MAG: tetratricopeptide repeat protein [Alphaproteobacteria bacterium]